MMKIQKELVGKSYWYIDWLELGVDCTDYEYEYDEFNWSIGNFFETKREAERAVKKLKAWKRLRDKGFQFEETEYKTGDGLVKITAGFNVNHEMTYQDEKDLDLLFGGEAER